MPAGVQTLDAGTAISGNKIMKFAAIRGRRSLRRDHHHWLVSLFGRLSRSNERGKTIVPISGVLDGMETEAAKEEIHWAHDHRLGNALAERQLVHQEYLATINAVVCEVLATVAMTGLWMDAWRAKEVTYEQSIIF